MNLVCSSPAYPYAALRAPLSQMYTLTNFRRYQALQSIPVLTDQRPSEPWRCEARFLLLRTFMDHLPADIHSQLLTKSIADPRRMAPEKTSSGQYKEELTPCNIFSSQDMRIFLSCLATPDQDHPLVMLEPAVQDHQHTFLPTQSVSTIASAETRLTSADHSVPIQFLPDLCPHLCCSSRTGWVPPSFLWIL